MKRLFLLLTALVIFSSHDMYLKFDSYFLPVHTEVTLQLFNGTFERSDNVIDRNRMADVSLIGPGQHLHPDTSQWMEKDSTTLLQFKTGESGTWVAGVSTRPRSIAMAAADFNAYLEHDGVLDMLQWREENNALGQDAVEKYSKHVKAIFQVGNRLTNDWQKVLGYPIEFVPLSNPYHLHEEEPLRIRLLWQGKPLANQLVYVAAAKSDHAHAHTHNDGATHTHDHEEGHHVASSEHQHTGQAVRTDADGVFSVNPDADGIWYVRTIYLTTTEEEGLTHESNWATLTFEVANRHRHGDETHTHAEEVGTVIPRMVYWVGSALLIVGLFFWFNRKKGE